MVKTFTQLRLRQAGRILAELGPFRIAGILFLGFGLIGTVSSSPLLLVLSGGGLIFNAHFNRQDKRFLRVLRARRYLLYVAEYSMMASPFLLGLLLWEAWELSGILALLLLSVPLLDFTLNSIPKFRLRKWPFIPHAAYEWKAGLRKNGWFIGILMITGFALAVYPLAMLAVILALSLATSGFWLQCESRPMIQAHGLAPKAFLLRRLTMQLALTAVLWVPFMLIFLYHLPAYWYALLYISLTGVGIQAFAVVFKYAVYEPGKAVHINLLFIVFVAFCYFIPFFIPVGPLLAIRYFNRAQTKLSPYLHAYH